MWGGRWRWGQRTGERAPVLDKGDLRPLDVDAAQQLADPLEAPQPILRPVETALMQYSFGLSGLPQGFVSE